MTTRPLAFLRELRRAASWHRRVLAAGLAAGAVAAGLHAMEAPEPPTTTVVAAARDLDAGVAITSDDLRTVALPPDVVPTGALRPDTVVVGRLLAGPTRAGEVLTDVRLLGPALVDGLPAGLTASPVRVADADLVALVRPGDRVDVLATAITGDAVGSDAEVVGAGLIVVAVPEVGTGGFADGALLVVAAPPAVARSLAAATVTSRLSITILGGDPAPTS